MRALTRPAARTWIPLAEERDGEVVMNPNFKAIFGASSG
jgi:hypothetical protein